MSDKAIAVKYIHELVDEIGNGFHPDHHIEEYVPRYSDEEAERLQVKLDFANEHLGDEVYKVGMDYMDSKEDPLPLSLTSSFQNEERN